LEVFIAFSEQNTDFPPATRKARLNPPAKAPAGRFGNWLKNFAERSAGFDDEHPALTKTPWMAVDSGYLCVHFSGFTALLLAHSSSTRNRN
jgi:hypothetical protein